jgi:hypothetical protein
MYISSKYTKITIQSIKTKIRSCKKLIKISIQQTVPRGFIKTIDVKNDIKASG